MWLCYGSTTPKELTSFFNQSKLVAMEIDKSQPQAKYVKNTYIVYTYNLNFLLNNNTIYFIFRHALDQLNEVLKL